MVDIKNNAVDLLKAYLGLVFHHYIEGVKFNAVDEGKQISKKITIKVQGKPIKPIDPLVRELDSFQKGGNIKGTHLRTKDDAEAYVNNHLRTMTLVSALIPTGPPSENNMPKGHDDAMKKALLMLKGAADRPNCQGTYLYRNYRLIHFGDWNGVEVNRKGKMVPKIMQAKQSCARIAIYAPIGIVVNDPSAKLKGLRNDVSVNPSKTNMSFTSHAKKQIASFYSKKFKWWKTYPQEVQLTGAAEKRGTWDSQGKKEKNKKGPPISLTVSPKDVLVGHDIHITCNASGTPKPDSYEITVDGKIFKNKEIKYQFTTTGMHKISAQGKKNGKGGVVMFETVTVLDKKGSSGGDPSGGSASDPSGDPGSDSSEGSGGDPSEESGGDQSGEYSSELVIGTSEPFVVSGKTLSIDPNSNFAKELYLKLKNKLGD